MATVVETVSDSGSASEALVISRDVVVADSAGGSNVDATAFNVSYPVNDAGVATDAAGDTAITNHAIEDAGLGADAIAVDRSLAQADSGAAADALALSRVIAISDAAVATDAASPSGSLVESIEDSAEASDALAHAYSYAVIDAAAAVDGLALARTVSVSDTANESTTAAPSAHVTTEIEDAADAADTPAARLTATYSVVDGASARDAPVSGNGEAFWTNLQSMAAARWTGQPFNSYAMHNGALIAAGPDGIAAFGADDDDGTPIVARVGGDLTDFGDPSRKVYDGAYVGARADGPLRLRIATENGAYNYDARPGSSQLSNVYFQLGRGLFSRYARFELTNPDGAAFTFRDAVVNVAATKRVR